MTHVVVASFVTHSGWSGTGRGDLHWRRAVDAYGKFGKGLHPAGLNFGDCMTYATASLAALPLLCTGDDFRQTDIELA